jgi:putative methyltransferase (TIGR04325 family)
VKNSILLKVLETSLRVKQGTIAYERDSVPFSKPNYDWSLLCCLLEAKNNSNGVLTVLDFGGALGSVYFQNKSILDCVRNISWNIVEQNNYVVEGKKHISSGLNNLHFYGSIEECLENCEPNFVLISSSLQYISNYREVLNKIDGSSAKFMYIDRTPFADVKDDIFAIQNVSPEIYDATYPIRIFSRGAFDSEMQDLWILCDQGQALDGAYKLSDGASIVYERRFYKRNQSIIKN